MIGSRYVPGGGTIGWPASRKLISAGVNILVRVLMRLSPRDCSGGYRCYRVSKLRQAGLDHLLSHGYSFQEEVLYRCRQVGCRIGETPIVFENRRAGASKADLREMVHSLAVLLRLGIPAFFGLDRWTASVRRQKPTKGVDQDDEQEEQVAPQQPERGQARRPRRQAGDNDTLQHPAQLLHPAHAARPFKESA